MPNACFGVDGTPPIPVLFRRETLVDSRYSSDAQRGWRIRIGSSSAALSFSSVKRRSTRARWRTGARIGPQGLEELLKTSIEAALETGTAKPESLERINVDTTVQPKAIAPPTDSGLYLKALQILVRQAEKHGIELRQSCMRLAKAATVRSSRYAHAGQFRRMHRELKRLRTFIGRILRGIGRKIAVNVELERTFVRLQGLVERLLAQKPKDQNKLYSLHAPGVVCISKGKARTPYEFGCKVGIEGLVLTAMTFEDNPSRGTRSHAPSIRLLRRCRSRSHLRRLGLSRS